MSEDATTFDLLVVGAGPGGIAAAVAARSITWFRQSRVIANPAPRTLLVETPAGP